MDYQYLLLFGRLFFERGSYGLHSYYLFYGFNASLSCKIIGKLHNLTIYFMALMHLYPVKL
jgi:hypothetical protein